VEQLDFDGTPHLDAPRRVMVQARQIYVYALAHRRAWFSAGEALSFNAYDSMKRHYHAADGLPGWVFSIHRDGRIHDSNRDLYAHAFVLFALASIAQLTGEREPLDRAQETLAFLDQSMSASSGGYIESWPTPSAPRRQNPHMHLLEAVLALHEVDPSGGHLERAEALVLLAVERFIHGGSGEGVLVEFFDDSLAPLDGTDYPFEPGHHFEWVWLLGSGLIDHNQNMAAAAMAIAEKKVCAHLSSRVAIRRQSFSLPNMFSILWRWR